MIWIKYPGFMGVGVRVARRLVNPALVYFWIVVAASVSAQEAHSSDSTLPQPSTHPNVVFVLVDTLRGDMLFGHREGVAIMPHLAELSKEGRVFLAASSPCSWTRPAMASLFTGQHVEVHQILFGSAPDGSDTAYAQALSPKWVTLAEALQGAGYRNYALVTNPNVAPGTGMEQGFAAENYHYELEAPATRVTQFALDLLPELPEPFFLYLHYMDPHAPYNPPHEFRGGTDTAHDLTAADHRALMPENQIPYLLESVRQSLNPSMPRRLEALSVPARSAMRRLYEGECRYVDGQIARLVESVRKRYPETLIVITADHGEQLWEHGGMGHGLNLFEEVLHVPLLILGAGIAPVTIRESVSTIGIYKSLVRHLGVFNATALAGLDLLAPSLESRPIFAATRGPEPGLPVDLQSVRSGQNKLIFDRLAGASVRYDLAASPQEQTPLPAMEDKQSRQLLGYLAIHNASVAAAVRNSPAADKVPLDAAALEQLEALGYIGGAAE